VTITMAQPILTCYAWVVFIYFTSSCFNSCRTIRKAKALWTISCV